MPEGDVETVYVEGRWANRIEGVRNGPNTTFARKEEAVDAGRDLARSLHVEHIIKNQDGTISDRSTYGHDPRNVPG